VGLLLACLAPGLVAAQAVEQNVAPGINNAYRSPNVDSWRGVFEREGREIWDRRHDILRELRLRPGQDVADVGAGTGFFSLMMAAQVGSEGRVYAVDIAPEFIEAIEQRARAAQLDNVVGVVNDARSVRLPPDSVDLVFSSDTYHHFEYPMTTLRSIYEALRPGGDMVIVDFKRIPGFSSPWVLGHVRAGEEQVTSEIRAAGFELVERPDFMRTQYFLRFRKPAATTPVAD
jgi:ubiquinone/menaquinone biosynthesis C-methylase UbiE